MVTLYVQVSAVSVGDNEVSGGALKLLTGLHRTCVCRRMQDDLAHALIDVLEYTSNQVNVYTLWQETSGKLQTLQGAGHFRHISNVLQTLNRLVS